MNKNNFKVSYFSRKLRSLMKERNITQKELERDTGISQGTISRYLRFPDYYDFNKITKAYLLTLSTYFNVNINDLLSEHGTGTGVDKNTDIGKISIISNDLIKMAKTVLNSNTEYSSALAKSIRVFHNAMENEKKIKNNERRLSVLEKNLTNHAASNNVHLKKK